MSVTHKPKTGATLTGTEYEAADSHVVSLAHTDLTAVTANQHHNQSHTQSDHTGTGATSTQAFGDAAADGTGTKPANIDHKHGMMANPFVLGTSPSTQAFGDAAAGGSAVDAAKTDHKHGMPANPVSLATPAIVLGSAAAAGAASTLIRSDSTIAAFDATNPTTQAMGDAAAVGTAAFAARRDHKHAMPALGFGLTSNSTPAVSLTTASAFITATTSLSAATYADITGASISLAAGTWLIMAHVFATDTTTTAGLLVAAITDNANALICEGAMSIPAGTATVSTWGYVGLCAFVSPGSTTTYKLRGARGTTTATATLVVQDGSPQNVANNASTNTDKGTGIFAVRIA